MVSSNFYSIDIISRSNIYWNQLCGYNVTQVSVSKMKLGNLCVQWLSVSLSRVILTQLSISQYSLKIQIIIYR